MCVQEYLKALRNGDTKDDTLKQEVENAVLNLKMRKEAIWRKFHRIAFACMQLC